jgi:hypothetical protein
MIVRVCRNQSHRVGARLMRRRKARCRNLKRASRSTSPRERAAVGCRAIRPRCPDCSPPVPSRIAAAPTALGTAHARRAGAARYSGLARDESPRTPSLGSLRYLLEALACHPRARLRAQLARRWANELRALRGQRQHRGQFTLTLRLDRILRSRGFCSAQRMLRRR